MARRRNNRNERWGEGVSRYTSKTLRRDREYGFFWYAWLWQVLRPVLVYLCALVVVLGIVATGWSMINERFFMAVEPGSTQTVDFAIESGNSVSRIATNLYEQQLIRHQGIFKYIVQFQGLTSKLQVGEYPLTRGMDVMQIVRELTRGSTSNERTITIIPGWTIEDIAEYLKSQGALSDTAQFLALSNNFEMFKDTYVLQSAAGGALAERKYQLEGYLAPDTYRVYTNAKPEDIIRRLLGQMETVVNDVYTAPPPREILRDEAGNLIGPDGEPLTGAEEEEVVFETTLNEDQTMILASIIEKEAGLRADFPKVAAVFHNRLERGMRLESDATASYPLGIDRLVLTAEELSSENGYNTYTRDGLPVGPICNPSKAAIQAALYPDMDYIYDGYLYFCTGDPEKSELVFAKTREEHLANVSKYRPLWVQYDQRSANATGQ